MNKLYCVRYYTLSDGFVSVDIEAESGRVAVEKAKEQDETFDVLESIGFIKELPAEKE